MDRRKRKRIYYVPGIISLAILPLVFIFFAKIEIREMTLVALRVFFTDSNYLKRHYDIFSQINGSIPPKRNYAELSFTGDDQSDNTKLEFAQVRIKEILSQNDSINGLHFKFGDSAKFGSLVATINVLAVEKAKTYMSFDKDLWFYHFPPDPSPDTNLIWVCGTETTYLYAVETEASKWTKTIKWAKHVWNSSWGIIIVFIAFLLGVSIFAKKS